MWGQFLFAACCFSLNMLVVSLAVLIRRLPEVMNGVRSGLRWGLRLSYRAYYVALSRLAPLFGRLGGLDILNGLPRLVATLLLSLLLGGIFLMLVGRSLTLWNVSLFALHGLLVGWLWDELDGSGGLHLGEHIS